MWAFMVGTLGFLNLAADCAWSTWIIWTTNTESDHEPHKNSSTLICGRYCGGQYSRAIHLPISIIHSRKNIVFIQEFLNDSPVHVWRRMQLQHDGSSSHYVRGVSDYLAWTSEIFWKNWIVRDGFFACSSELLDLYLFDYFIWGEMKNIVCDMLVTSEIDLDERLPITAGITKDNNRNLRKCLLVYVALMSCVHPR